MRVLITGGHVFIGSHLCEALLGEGFRVSLYDLKLCLGSQLCPSHPAVKELLGKAYLAFTSMVPRTDNHQAVFFNSLTVLDVAPGLRSIVEIIFRSET